MAQGSDTMIILVLIALAGLGSMLLYLRRRQWIDACLIAVAAAALAAMVGSFSMPADEPVRGVAAAHEGLSTETLSLDFARQLELGRIFSLTVQRTKAAPWRLQLLAENDQVIAEAKGASTSLTVQWLPPTAETMVLKARLYDGAGKLLAQGPVPLQVRQAAPLQVRGRFGAPSFDTRALNALLADSNALLDWQVTLGKTVTRRETARAEMTNPNLLVVDAAYVESMSQAARTALLAQVAAGTPLLVLAANARAPQLWARTLKLALAASSGSDGVSAPLALSAAPLNPSGKVSGPWSGGNLVWSRSWGQGRIVWLGASGWHRYAISLPQVLGLWWQDVLDQAGVRRVDDVMWLAPQQMPMPGQRMQLCALGVRGEVNFPGLKQTLAWQRRPDRADAHCVAVWPDAPGWLSMHTQGAAPQVGQVYVFAKDDWPLWQNAQRRDAALRDAARTPVPMPANRQPLPAWPFAMLFVLSMLLLWWRERR
jgi:hypothetical protein